MNSNESFSQIPIRPLTMRGVFGISWAVAKRRFWSAVAFSLIMLLLISIVVCLCITPMIVSIAGAVGAGAAPDEDSAGPAVIGSVFISISLMLIVFAAISILINPIYGGTLYSEMTLRVYGQASTLGTLFKRCKYSFKRFFTLNLSHMVSLMVANSAVSLVESMFSSVFLVGSIFSSFGSLVESGYLDGLDSAIGSGDPLAIIDLYANVLAAFIVPLLILSLIRWLLTICARSPLCMIYPVAINEDKRHFKAVGRSLKLGFKRYGRVFAAQLIYSFVMLLLQLVLVGLLVLGMFLLHDALLQSPAILIAIYAVYIPLSLLLSSVKSCFSAALDTVLYFDSVSREQPAPAQNGAQPVQPPVYAQQPQQSVQPINPSYEDNSAPVKQDDEPLFVPADDAYNNNNSGEQ